MLHARLNYSIRFTRYGGGSRQISAPQVIQAASFMEATTIAHHIATTLDRSDPRNDYDVYLVMQDGVHADIYNGPHMWPLDNPEG